MEFLTVILIVAILILCLIDFALATKGLDEMKESQKYIDKKLNKILAALEKERGDAKNNSD